MWPEIEAAKKEHRRELSLSGSEISKRIDDSGLDITLFSLSELNYLSLTDTNVHKIPSEILKLNNLQTLILHSNKIKYCDQNIFKLPKLKVLDLSRNLLTSLPDNITTLLQIVSLNLSYNKLDAFSILSNCTKLAVLDLSNNNLKLFPNVCFDYMISLSEIKLHGNKIEEIPTNIDNLPSLKTIDLSENCIKVLPGELADCHKLKEINLKSNPIIDRRLKKLIEQCRTKQIVDYVKQHCQKSERRLHENKNLQHKAQGNMDIKKAYEEDLFKYNIHIKPSNENIKIIIHDSVKLVREHITCCIINKIAFTEDLFKKFIQLQNRLHDKVCDKRNIATIATHDLKKMGVGIVKYTTFPPDELKIKPLHRSSEMSGIELVTKLQSEANNLRKEKKRNTYSGIHKYLYMVEGAVLYPCLLNKDDNIDVSSTDILLEVTSKLSQKTCNNVAEEVLKEIVYLFEKDLEIQQVKIFDNEEKLKMIFPSRSDLNFNPESSIKIIRE
ncbi:leucine-rich repeat-containing protein 47-like isoform X2 [Rhynchophorus ferrugineus]|uniref:leucine-rich repeat-containing protein 47-like isoform X2 n=1 Tax=Rhynchophorus ferrugineus TaxID=354439 RepID=UPI003FCDE5CA